MHQLSPFYMYNCKCLITKISFKRSRHTVTFKLLLMCSAQVHNVHCAYTHKRSFAATLHHSGPVETASATAVPMSCMRIQSDPGSQLVCLCHLDGEGHYLSTLESSSCCEASGLTTIVDLENDFLPPRSSSPPEIASSSPQSTAAFSDEEGSIKIILSSESSPFNTPSLPRRNLARSLVDFSQDFELPLPDSTCSTTTRFALRSANNSDCLLNGSPSCACFGCLSGSPIGSLHFSSGLRADSSWTNYGLVDTDNDSSAWEGKKETTVMVLEADGPSGNIMELSPITFRSNSESHKSR
jgi:hypothetical protein